MGENGSDFFAGYSMGRSEGTNNGGGWGNGWGNDIIGLAALGLIFGRNGLIGGGMYGGDGGGAPWATQADVRAAVDQQTLISKLDQQTYGLADSTYALNSTITNGFHGVDNAICNLGFQMKDCCCETQRLIERGFCDTNFNIANQTRDIIESNNCNFRALNDTIRDGFARAEARENQRYIADLERKLNNCDRDAALQGMSTYLINTLRPMPVPSYQSCNPWAACYGNWNNGGCGGCC